MTTRLRRRVGTTVLLVALVGAGAVPSSAAAAGTTAGAAGSVRAQVATPIADDVRAFRMDVRATLTDYRTRYGNRLTTERQRMQALQGQVDRQLTLVELRTARAERLSVSSASSAAKLEAAREASGAFDRAHASAMSSLAEVEPILRPKLSLFEGLEAKGDLDDMLARYDEIGGAIHDFEAGQRR
jgi:hypothetical protein